MGRGQTFQDRFDHWFYINHHRVDGFLVGLMFLLVILIALVVRPALAADNGQFENVPDNIRSWFKSVRSPNGVPCCDIADGHHTTWRATSDGSYEAPIRNPEDPEGSDHWYTVPPEAIVYNQGNPNEDAIVWYVRQGTNVYFIRCFVPGGGV